MKFETFDQSEEETWRDQQKKQWQRHRQRQWQRQIHLENTFKEQPQRLVTLETFDQSDEGTWLDQQKGKDKDKDKDNDKDKDTSRTTSKSDPRDLWPLRHLITMMRTDNLTKKVHWQWQRQNWKIIENRYVSTLLHSWSLSSNKTQGLRYSRSLSSNKSHGLTGIRLFPRAGNN